MAFDLDAFRNQFASGGARPSQFTMQITWPDAVRGVAGVGAAEKAIQFLCNMSELPAETINEATVKYFGRTLKFAGDRVFEDVTITVMNDEDFLVRKAMESWTQAIQDRQ